jgi:hypothetical protein
LLAHPHLLRSETEKVGDARADGARYIHQKRRETRQGAAATREQSQVVPRIKIVLACQQKNFSRITTPPKLGAIGVSFPANPAEQSPISRTKRNEITPTAMIGTKHEPSALQLRERVFDVGRAQTRAIASNRDHFVITKSCDCFDGVLETRLKTVADLPMDRRGSRGVSVTGGEKMNVGHA